MSIRENIKQFLYEPYVLSPKEFESGYAKIIGIAVKVAINL